MPCIDYGTNLALSWHLHGMLSFTTCLAVGKEQRWMIIAAPFCFAIPLGGAPESVDNDNQFPAEKDDESSFDDDEYRVRNGNREEDDEYRLCKDNLVGYKDSEEQEDLFFDCDSD